MSHDADEPSSPACLAHEGGDAYMGFATAAEHAAFLNELLEAERAGTTVARLSAEQAGDGPFRDLLRDIHHDEARWCAMLLKQLKRLDAPASAKVGAFSEKALAIEADVTDRAAMVAAFDAAEKAFGTVTILVNNAGVAQQSVRATEVTAEEWRRVLGVDLDAVFYWAQEGARRMIAAKKPGAIVNIASVLGFGVSKGTTAYAVAKAAVVQTTKALSVELAFKGIRVNAIAPGWFVTEINDTYLESEAGSALKRDIPMGRFGNEGDLDGALLLLVSDAGAYMAGATIVVDGGQVVKIA